jgi:hypothetical protein
MKKFGVFALLLSLSVFAIGCKPAEKPADPAPEAAAPTTEAAPAEGAPAAEAPKAE